MQPTKEKPLKSNGHKDKPESSPCIGPPVTVDRRTEYSSMFKWVVPNFKNFKAKSLYSPYFEVGGFDFRFLIYPKGDSLSLPGHISVYLQIHDPRGNFDCCANYRITIVNVLNDTKSVYRDSCYRFSKIRKSIGWSEFTVSKTILDPASGFLNHGSLLISLDIHALNEIRSFSADSNETKSFVLDGRLTWTIRNYSLFKEIIKTQKIISSSFQVGEGNLRIHLYTTVVDGIEYLSLCLDTKDTEKCILFDRSFWCLFRISVLNQKPGLHHVHRDSHGRFSLHNLFRDEGILGWTQYMKMSDFTDGGFLVDDTVIVSVSFNAIRESSIILKSGNLFGGKNAFSLFKKGDGCSGKFLWKIENFVRLKDLLKKKKLTCLCVKSRSFRIGSVDFRLLVYPRGKSQKPFHLSLFLEVLDPGNTLNDWSSFVIYRLAVMNHKMIEKSIIRESHDRCSKATKDWGWSEFITLTSFFDLDSGYLDQDIAVFTAEVRVLKETFTLKSINESSSETSCIDMDGKKLSLTWKVENFSSLMDIIADRKIFCKYFQVGGCKLRIGFYESSENIFVYLESDPSVSSDPEENFWVSYKIAVVNQKEPTKSLWKESSICTNSCISTDFHFMKVSNMLAASAGFVVRETAVFTCEILDCCPWFDFSGGELLSVDNDGNDVSCCINKVYNPEDNKVRTGKMEKIFNALVASAGCYLIDEDSSRQLILKLKELLIRTGTVAGLLIGMRFYFDDPVKVNCLFTETKRGGCNSLKKHSEADVPSADLTNAVTAVKVLQQTINDALLDIMVECCQPSNNSIYETSAASSKPSAYYNITVPQLEFHPNIGPMVSMQPSSHGGSRSGINVTADSDVFELLVVNGDDLSKNTVFGQRAVQPETSISDPMDDKFFVSEEDKKKFQALKTGWPEPSEKLLQLVVNSLKMLDGPVSQVHPKPRQRSPSAEKVLLLLENAPKYLHPDLVILLPKLLNSAEHPPVSCALLDQLNQLDAEPALRPLVLATISQLNLDNKQQKQTIYQACQLLADSNGEVLGAVMDFLFEAAYRCHHIPQAVRAVHARFKSLGAEVSYSVLDHLRKVVNSHHEIAESMLREIGFVFALDGYCLTNPSEPSSNGGSGPVTDCFHLAEEPHMDANHHFSDIFLLINMLAIPPLAGEASKVFESGIAHGFIEDHSVAMVLEKYTQRFHANSESSADNYQHQVTERDETVESSQLEGVFTLVLALARTLSLSGNSRVHSFVKMFYMMLFRLFSRESYHKSMLKDLVDLAISPADICSDIILDTLVFLIHEEHGFARPVLSMMRDAAQNFSTETSTIQHQLRTMEEELVCARDEKQKELSNLSSQNAILLENLTQSKAAFLQFKSEMEHKMDCFACEKKELCGHIKAAESELEQFCSKQKKKIMKLSMEKKDYQDHLRFVEAQLSQLKSEKHQELKQVSKENKVLAERLRRTEAETERIDRELKRYALEVVAQEEIRQTLMDEIRQLKQKIQQNEKVAQEKEEEFAHCRAYTEYIEARLNTCQQYFLSLENALQEEMLQHAPLYGVGLEDLSMKELETLSRIHEDGLKEIHRLQNQLRSPRSNPVSSVLQVSHSSHI